MKDNRKIISLSERDHILTRPNMYIGATASAEKEEWVLNEEGKVEKKNLTYSDGLYVIIKEILENSLDEYIRTNGRYSNKITFDVKDDKIIIQDNGRGLPVEQGEDGEWMPVTAFTKLRAGSNFSDEDRKTIGTNGYGSSATNVFSKSFEVITCDGKKKLKLTCKDNLSTQRFTVSDVTEGKTGTKVTFLPDYKRFGIEHFPEEMGILFKTHLRMLSWFFPKCDFRYNGEKMSLKVKEVPQMFPSLSVVLSTDNIYILVYPSEEPEVLTYVNGMKLRRGGNHVEYILNTLTSDIKDKLSKKYKSIKPLDIKNRLGIVVFFKDFPNCQFDSQTKDALTNNEKDIKVYLDGVDLTSKLSNKILKEKAIIENITDMFQFKEDLKEKKELAKLNSKRRDIDSTKYVPCIGEKKYLCITEGQSAYGGIAPILGRKGIAYYQIKGKILNVQDLSIKKAMENDEIADLVAILGIDITNPESTINFEKVLITSDQDNDGIHICSLILSLFNKLCPNVVKEGRICRLNTPLLVGLKGRKVMDYYFELPDQSKLDKNLTWIYQKGLGGWGGLNKDLLPQIMEKEGGGLDSLLLSFKKDNHSNPSLENWMGDKSDYRKDKLRNKSFRIDLI